MKRYLSYFIEVYDTSGALYTYVFPRTLYGISELQGVYKHTLEVISQKFDCLADSDGSLSISQLEAIYNLNNLRTLHIGEELSVTPKNKKKFMEYRILIYEVGVNE